MKGIAKPTQVNESYIFDVNKAELSEINSLPSWLRDKVIASDEYRERFPGSDEGPELKAEDIPF
jgi:hypothetical protein